MKLYHTLFLCLALGAIFTANATSTPKLSITTEHWPPNSYLDSNGQITGVATAKIHKVLTTAKLQYEIQLYPWARAYHLARSEPYTAIYSIMKSYKREALFQWVCPLLEQGSLYFIKLAKRKDIVLKAVKDAKSYTFAVSRDEFDHQYLIQHAFKEGDNFQLTSGHLVHVKLLLAGHTDLIMGNRETIYRNLKDLGRSPDEIAMALPLNTAKDNPLCLAFGLKTPKSVVDKVRNALLKVNMEATSP